MKKNLAKIAAVALTGALVVGAAVGFSACGNKGETMKIGVLVSDVNGDEAKAFRNYYENYIEKQYNVDFTYTEALADAAGERAAIEKFAAQGYGAVISLSASDRAMQIETCEKNEIYYAVASGMLEDEQYNKYKSNKYFVGQIGPDMATEYEAGKAMGKYYKDAGKTKVVLYGAFIPNPMHVYRAAGVLDGLGLSYGGAQGQAIVPKLFEDQAIDTTKITGTGVSVIGCLHLNQDYSPNVTELTGYMSSNPDVLISVGMATTFWSEICKTNNLNYGDIDAFTAGNVVQMSQTGGKLTYLAGKYSSSIGPIFAAVYNAVNGNAIRDGGNAISIGQNYGVATTAEAAAKYQTADSGSNPIINKALLDTVIGKDISYSAFKTFVETDRTPA